MFARTPYYVLTGGLVIIFLFPIAWATIASFSAQAGSAQTFGYGLGNYAAAVRLPGGPAQVLH